MFNLLGLSAGASKLIWILVTVVLVVVLVFMLVYRKRKSIQAAHANGEQPVKKEKKEKKKKEKSAKASHKENKDLLADIIAVHEQKQAEANEQPDEQVAEEQAEPELKETENIEE